MSICQGPLLQTCRIYCLMVSGALWMLSKYTLTECPPAILEKYVKVCKAVYQTNMWIQIFKKSDRHRVRLEVFIAVILCRLVCMCHFRQPVFPVFRAEPSKYVLVFKRNLLPPSSTMVKDAALFSEHQYIPSLPNWQVHTAVQHWYVSTKLQCIMLQKQSQQSLACDLKCHTAVFRNTFFMGT